MRRVAAWILMVGSALAGVALVVASPNDLTYWLSLFLVLPLLMAASSSVLPRWTDAPRWARRLAWAAVFALAVGGGALYLLVPGGASYAVGGLLVLPLIVLMASNDTHEPTPRDAVAPVDGPWGLP